MANGTDLPVGVSMEELATTYPQLFHLTHVSNVPAILALGLRCTSDLLDLCSIAGPERRLIEAANRRESVWLRCPEHGDVVIRDQKPMTDAGLRRALRDGLTPEDWYRKVNAHVFFWVDPRRVETLLGARAYRTERHALFVASTAEILRRFGRRVVLSPLNTGATMPMPHPRGLDCFVPVQAYPFAEWRRRRGWRKAVVELAIGGSIPEFLECVDRVAIVGAGQPDAEVEMPPTA